MLLQGCYSGVIRVSRSLTGVIHGCFRNLTRVIQESYRGVTKVLQECYRSLIGIRGTAGVLLECFWGVTVV